MPLSDDEVHSDSLEQAATRVVELGNNLVETDLQVDPWDIADGLLAGAVHFWLYSRQPCDDPMCEDCAPLSIPEQRLAELLRLVEQMARDSDYYHSPHDLTVGRA